ncbi:MAG: hypothetical protein KDH88_18115 [Chromatiales bacterium]|nr:hypothetical protein [Chromatiales bacterium]
MHPMTVALFCLAVSSCALNPYQGEDRRATLIPLGSQFEITKPFVIPARELAVYFRLGNVVGPTAGDELEYTCELNVLGRSDRDRPIASGTFSLTENRHYETKVARDSVIQENRFYLRSPQHPELDKLFCRATTYPPNFDPLTIAGLREALGAYFRVDLAE